MKIFKRKSPNVHILEALLSMWQQYAFPANNNGLWTGGMSALESAEEILEFYNIIDSEGKEIEGWRNFL